MIRLFTRYLVQFILLVLIQVYVLNNIQLGGYLNPYLYIMFILLLPFQTPQWLLLVLAFFLGLSIDLFTHTPGMHSTATVFMAFVRPYALRLISPREGYETGTNPSLHFYGFNWYLRYALILVFSHHVVLFFIEAYRFSDFFYTFARVILSTALTTLLIITIQFLFYRD